MRDDYKDRYFLGVEVGSVIGIWFGKGFTENLRLVDKTDFLEIFPES